MIDDWAQSSIVNLQIVNSSIVNSSIHSACQVHDRGPEAAAEAEGGDRDEDGGRAPNDEARLQGPEGAEAGADHHDESREERIDVERSDPLAVFAGEGDAAAGAARAHDEVALEELPLAADRASEPETPQDYRAPVALGKGSGPASCAMPGKNGRRAGFHATSMTADQARNLL